MHRQFSKSLICLATLVAASWIGNECSAGTIMIGPAQTLSSLIANPNGITVGDKKFTQFGYLASGDMPAATGVNVVPIQDDDLNFGIRFQGAFADLASSQGGSDALITYRVEATDPRKFISDAHLAGNPNLLGTTGSVNVTETFLPAYGGQFTMQIYDDEQNPGNPQLTDVVFFTPVTKFLDVQKDILIFAGNQTNVLSFVDQTFSQIEVPEPTTVMMSMIGIVSLVGLMRRKSA